MANHAYTTDADRRRSTRRAHGSGAAARPVAAEWRCRMNAHRRVTAPRAETPAYVGPDAKLVALCQEQVAREHAHSAACQPYWD